MAHKTYKVCFTDAYKNWRAAGLKSWRRIVKREPTKQEQTTFIERPAREHAKNACFHLHPKFPG